MLFIASLPSTHNCQEIRILVLTHTIWNKTRQFWSLILPVRNCWITFLCRRMGTSTSHTSNYVNFVRQYFTIKVSQEITLKVFRVLHSLKQSLTNSNEPNLIEHSCYFTSLILYITVSSNISQGITEANLLPFLSKYRGLPVFHCPPFYIHTVVRCTNDCGLQLSPSALSPTSFPRSLDRSQLYSPLDDQWEKVLPYASAWRSIV